MTRSEFIQQILIHNPEDEPDLPRRYGNAVALFEYVKEEEGKGFFDNQQVDVFIYET